jgi:hypothetical protein
MTRAILFPALAALLVLWTGPVWAQEGDAPEETPPEAVTPQKSAPTAPAEGESASRPGPPKPPPSRGKAVRTLDEITIEGEIAVPQVLFITARDRQRYQDLLHRRYRQSSLELGRAAAFPRYIIARF